MSNGVAQTIVAPVTAALLQSYRPHRQIELIVRDQDLGRRDFIEVAQLTNREAAAVHVSRGLQQHQLVVLDTDLRGLTGILSVIAELAAVTARKQVYEPETRIVTGHLMFRAWIAQADDDTQR